MTIIVSGGMTTTNNPLQGRLGRQQQDLFIRKLRELNFESEKRKARLHTIESIFAYQNEIKNKFVNIFDSWPTPGALNPQLLNTLQRTGYRIENILFESLPGFYVSGNLYIPDTASTQTPVPGVVQLCGHDSIGKANSTYQAAAQGLAKLGFACFTIDAVGIGERKQIPSTPVEEHRLIGQQLPLLNLSLAGMQTWDAKRAVDYLLSRPDINPNYIGAIGNSGGGTQAMWLIANDSRITMGAVSCCVHTFLANLENELYADAEQTPARILEFGLDIDDILATFAPKPLLLIGQKLDYFDERAVREIHYRLTRIYDRLGATNNLRLYIGPGSHGFSYDGRQQMYQWFRKAVFGDDTAVIESTPTTESELNLRCTSTGNVNDLPDSVTSYELLREMADDAVIVRGNPTGEILKNRVKEVLNISDWPQYSPPHYRFWSCYYPWTYSGASTAPVLSSEQTTRINTVLQQELQPPNNATSVLNAIQTSLAIGIVPPNYPKSWGQVYAVETEDDILIPLYHNSTGSLGFPLQPVIQGTRALLYIPHFSADQELSKPGRDALVNTIVAAEPSAPLFAVDLRGYGELKPNLNTGILPENYIAQHSDMLGKSMLGRMVFDLLRVCDLLAAHGYVIHIAGRGHGSIPAALAALLHPSIVQVTLLNSLTRWHACARAKHDQQAWPQAMLPRGVLLNFDLPNVYTDLASKGLVNTSQFGAWFANPNGEW